MLRASPPDDGADADGRFDVDSVLVTEFLLSFVGTLAGRNDSSDIGATGGFRAFLVVGIYRCVGLADGAAQARSATTAEGLSRRIKTRSSCPTAPAAAYQIDGLAAPNLFCGLLRGQGVERDRVARGSGRRPLYARRGLENLENP